MKFADLLSGIRLFKFVLDHLQDTKTESIRERYIDILSDGVLEDELNNMSIVGKDVDPLLQTDRVKVDTGVAYKNGERILIDDATIAYDPANLTLTTDNGKGSPVVTPASTGSFDIPLTLGSINYIYIAYLQTTDPTSFSLHKISNEKLFYKRTDGYEISVNTTGVNPDSSRFILLGTVDVTAGTGSAISSNISIVSRPLSRTKKRRILIETANISKTDRPASYSLGNNKFSLDDHIKAVGTGAVSPTNPHGVSLSDIGVQPNQTVEEHRRLEHSNGIIAGISGDPFPSTSAMFVQHVARSGGLQDSVVIKALLPTEVAIVNGTGFSSSAFSVDVELFFTDDNTSSGTPLASDTYQIVFDSTTEEVSLIQGGTPITDTTKLWLGTAVYDGVDALVGSILDRRKIGGTVRRLQLWTNAGRPDPSIATAGMIGYNVDLNRPEYNNGSTWVAI